MVKQRWWCCCGTRPMQIPCKCSDCGNRKVDEIDDTLLAVLRQCVEALETHVRKSGEGSCTCGAVAALDAARPFLESKEEEC